MANRKPKLQVVVSEFCKEMWNKGIPHYVAGIIRDKEGNPVIEVVVQRPERYNNPEIVAKIPKTFQGIRVFVA